MTDRESHPETDVSTAERDAQVLGYLMGERPDAPLAEVSDLEDLRALLADPTLWEQPPALLADKVVAAVAVAASTAPALRSAPEAAPDELPGGAAVSPLPRPRRPRSRLTLLGGSAIAIAASIVLGTVVGVNLGGDSPGSISGTTSTGAQVQGIGVPAPGLPSVALSPQEKEQLSQQDLRELEGGPFAGPELGRFPGLVFWLTNSPDGSPRLSREITAMFDHAGRANGALRALLNRRPADPDERSPWPVGSTGDVDLSSVHGGTGAQYPAGTAVVYLNSAALGARTAAAEARAAVQQIGWTLRANDPTITAVVLSALDARDRKALDADGLWGSGESVGSPVRPADPAAVLAGVQLDSPAEGAVLEPKEFEVSGAAISATGRIRWEVLERGQVIRRGEASTGSCCSLSPFTFRLTLPPGRYTVVVHPGPTGTADATSRTVTIDSVRT